MMSKQSFPLVVPVSALLLMFAGPLHAVPTLVNPSFEADSFPTFPGYAGGNGGVITGWTIGGSANRVGINTMTGPFASGFPIPDGTQTGFVQNAIGATGTLSTTITDLVPGQEYTVTYRTNSRNQPTRPLLRTSLGDFASLTSIAPSAAEYGFGEFGFTADSTMATLTFANVNGGPDSTALIDAIRVTEGAPPIANVGVQASSNLGAPFDRNARYLVDRSGLDVNGPGTHSITLEGVHWLSTGTFQAPNDLNPEVVFDLGAPHDVSSIRIWNYNEAEVVNLTTRGVADFDLLVADSAAGPFTPVGTFTLAQAPGVDTVDFSETFDINTRARFVKIDPLNSHGGDNAFVGLSEVQFAGQVVRGPSNLVTGVTIADVSSNLAGFDRGAQYLVDSSGLFNDTHTIAPDGFMWLTQGTFGGGDPDLDPEVTFDLGRSIDLTNVKIWNYNEDLPGRPELLGRGVNVFEILVSDDLDGPFASLGVFDLSIAPGLDNVDFSQTFGLNTRARYVRFDILSNHGGDNNFVGLSEVQFFGDTQLQGVPEPGTAGLLLAACAGLLLRTRRRA